MCKNMPAEWQNKLMHASFKAENIFFMSSDVMSDGNGFGSQTVKPETSPISLSLNFTDTEKQTEVFNKLADGGTVTMPLQDTFWGARFGMLNDRFGIRWMFNCDK